MSDIIRLMLASTMGIIIFKTLNNKPFNKKKITKKKVRWLDHYGGKLVKVKYIKCGR